MEKQINALELQIKHVAEQLNVTIDYCLEQYEKRKTHTNAEAILGVAWQCINQAKKINCGEDSSTPQLLNMTVNDLVSFYVCKAADAYGMAKMEAQRLNPIIEHQRRAAQGAKKYSASDKVRWSELADQIDPERKMRKCHLATCIAKQCQLPDKAIQTIRKTIRK
jgi:hypothetical protein